MAATRDVTIEKGVWTRIATNPTALTIKSNTGTSWQLAITASGEPGASLIGEIHKGGDSWPSGSIAGEVYVKANLQHQFAVTQEGGSEG